MLSIFRRLVRDEKGFTAIEYALFVSLITVAAISSMRTVGRAISNVFYTAMGAMN